MKKQSDPWYKHRWPWLLMAGPVTVIIAGIITTWLAVVSFDGLVEDDYYKQGLSVNQRIQRDRVAAEQGIEAELMLGEGGRQLRALIRAADAGSLPASVSIRLTHPTKPGLDQQVVLTSEGNGFYLGAMSAPVSGRWQVTLTDPAQIWRLTGDWNVQADTGASLRLGGH